jgi:transposase
MAIRRFLTDEQWAVLAPLIPLMTRRADGRGRPVEHDDRAVMDGVLWVLRTAAKFGLPVVVLRIANAVLAAYPGDLHARLGFFQHPDDLFFRESMLHAFLPLADSILARD